MALYLSAQTHVHTHPRSSGSVGCSEASHKVPPYNLKHRALASRTAAWACLIQLCIASVSISGKNRLALVSSFVLYTPSGTLVPPMRSKTVICCVARHTPKIEKTRLPFQSAGASQYASSRPDQENEPMTAPARIVH